MDERLKAERNGESSYARGGQMSNPGGRSRQFRDLYHHKFQRIAARAALPKHIFVIFGVRPDMSKESKVSLVVYFTIP